MIKFENAVRAAMGIAALPIFAGSAAAGEDAPKGADRHTGGADEASDSTEAGRC